MAFSPAAALSEPLGRLDLFDGDFGLGGTAHAGGDRFGGGLGAGLAATGGPGGLRFLVGDECAFEGLVADVAFEPGVVVLVLAEEAAALLLRRGRGVVFVEVAAVVAVAVVVVAVLVLQVDAHEVFVGAAQPAGDRAEGRGGDDQQGGKGEQAVDGQRDGGVDGGQRGGGQVAEHAAGTAQPVEPVGDGRFPADDVGQAGAGERHDQEADADPVVAAAVDGLAEQPEGADEQHQRQQQRHPAEGAVDDAVDHVREPALESPPGEGGDEHAEGQVEQGCAVAAVLGREVADVVADPADARPDDVGNAQPGAGHNPDQPGLLRVRRRPAGGCARCPLFRRTWWFWMQPGRSPGPQSCLIYRWSFL